MPTPEGLNTTTLHMKFVEPDSTGTPLQGSLTFTPNPSPIIFPNENIIVAGTETATLDVDGEATIELISTDQAGENPTGWLYTVTEKIAGQRQRTYNIALPYNSGVVVELADIVPTDAAPTYIPVIGPQGAPGVITTINGHSTATVTLVAADLPDLIPLAQKGAASGVATLDSGTKVPVAQIPDLSSTYILTSQINAASGVAGLTAGGLVGSAQLPLASSAPPSVGTSAVGTSTNLARQDHTHSGVDLTTGQSIAGAKNFTTSVQTAQLGVGVAPGGQRAHVKSTVNEIVLFVEQTAASPTSPIFLIQSAGASDSAYGASVSGDSVNRITVSTGGTFSWGSGSAAADVTLARTAVGELTVGGQILSSQSAPTASGHLTRKDYVDNNFTTLTTAQTVSGVKTFSVAPNFQAASSSTVVTNYKVTGDANPRQTVTAAGTISWGDGTAAVDTILSRVSGPALNLNANYQSTRSATSGVAFNSLVTGDTFDRYRIYADGLNEWGPGNAARDTNLYRSAANVLKTDDSLIVAIDLTVNGNITNSTGIRYRATVTGSTSITFASATSNTSSISFGTTFASAPTVLAMINSGAGSTVGWTVRALNITTTGCDLSVSTNGSAAAWSSIPVMWVAIAP